MLKFTVKRLLYSVLILFFVMFLVYALIYSMPNGYVETKELLDTTSEVRGTKKIKVVLPMWLAKVTAPLSEAYYAILKSPPLYTRYSLYTISHHVEFTNEKAKKELGFSNRSIRETVADTVCWLEEQGRIPHA